jgi:hypothetical protein
LGLSSKISTGTYQNYFREETDADQSYPIWAKFGIRGPAFGPVGQLSISGKLVQERQYASSVSTRVPWHSKTF